MKKSTPEYSLFSCFFLAVSVLFTAVSFSLEGQSRLIPLAAGISTCVVMVLVMTKERFPDSFLTKLDSGVMREPGPEPATGGIIEEIRAEAVLRMAGWIGFFFLMVFLAGFIFAVPVFTFVFLKFRGKSGWGWSFISACLLTAAVFVIFQILMGVILFKGVIFGEVIPPV